MPITLTRVTAFWLLLIFAATFVLQKMLLSLGLLASLPFSFLLSLAIFGYPTYRSFKEGKAGTAATPPKRWKYLAIPLLLVVGLVGGVVLLGVIRYHSASTIEGKYNANDPARSTAEFLSDGTLVFVSGGQQGIWTWQKLENGKLKLTPGADLNGTKPALCDYQVDPRALVLSGCHLSFHMTRM